MPPPSPLVRAPPNTADRKPSSHTNDPHRILTALGKTADVSTRDMQAQDSFANKEANGRIWNRCSQCAVATMHYQFVALQHKETHRCNYSIIRCLIDQATLAKEEGI